MNAVLVLNPLRYRGYVYDDETGLYYLQSRYYDPTICRFINADNIDYLANSEHIFNTNLFTYCNNNFRESDYNGKYSNYFSSNTYNRSKALRYAQLNWNRKTFTNQFSYYEKGDCANFVSQCLYKGGIRMSNFWHFYKSPIDTHFDDYRAYGNHCELGYAPWTYAPDHFHYFSNCGFTTGVFSLQCVQYKLFSTFYLNFYNVRAGDLLYLDFNKDKRNPTLDHPYISHVTMISSVIKIGKKKELFFTAHTSGCYNRRLLNVYDDFPNMIIYIVTLL